MKKALWFLLLLITGCGPGFVEYLAFEDLGNGYAYREELGYPLIERDDPSRKVIPTIVIDYEYNTDFILATQKNNKICWETMKRPEFDSNECYNLIEEKGIKPNYWIISHALDSIFGPLSKEEYLKKRKELGVPDELMLEDE